MKHLLVDVAPLPSALKRFESIPGVKLHFIGPSEELREQPAELIRTANVVFCTTPPANVAEAKALEWVQLTSVGFSQLYGLGFDKREVRATNGRGVYDVTIAEWNLAMMVNLARDVRGMIRNQEHGIFDRAARFQNEIRGKVVGLWGYGGIGRCTARLAKAWGLSVHALARKGVGPRTLAYQVPGTGDPDGTLPDRVFTAGQEIEFLKSLDFLVLAMPQTPTTTGILGERELHALNRTAYILNPARGPLIQEQALLRALREGWIAGAALDTHYYYPMPADHPLWRFPNVIMTPHISGSSESPYYPPRIWDVFAQNTERFLRNEPLLNEITPAELAGA